MKLYKITFIEYTDVLEETVSDNNEDISKINYIHVGSNPLIVTENQLEEIKQFGKGIRTCVFIGNLWDENNPYTSLN